MVLFQAHLAAEAHVQGPSARRWQQRCLGALFFKVAALVVCLRCDGPLLSAGGFTAARVRWRECSNLVVQPCRAVHAPLPITWRIVPSLPPCQEVGRLDRLILRVHRRVFLCSPNVCKTSRLHPLRPIFLHESSVGTAAIQTHLFEKDRLPQPEVRVHFTVRPVLRL